jgi:ADP-ribosylglycohydrolase
MAAVIHSSPLRASASLFGLAYGDALGKPTEFLTVAEIERRYGSTGPRDLIGDPALVTDDTQMALAVGWALHEAPALTPEAVEPLLRRRFVAWSVSPDNNRAPGMTCLRACADLDRGLPWQEATVAGSKGCGANMRVTPVGLLDADLDTLAGLAQLQAGLTHGHPTGLAASELTAYAVFALRGGVPLPELRRCSPSGRGRSVGSTTRTGWAISGDARGSTRRRSSSLAAGTSAWRRCAG